MKLLLAEDDAKLAKLLLHLLRKDGHLTDWVENGHDALDYALYTPYDAVILDWMMPGKDGIEVCRELRKAGFTGGILFMTARHEVDDRVIGLDEGADDYVIKPVQYEELAARLRSLDRRIVPRIPGAGTLNPSDRSLRAKDITVTLTAREYQLLDILLKRFGRIVTHETLIEMIWGLNSEASENAVEVLVRLLRKKLDAVPTGWKLLNIRSVGYKLEEEADVSEHS
ncbi:response regulator transcription factor [Paenibacillus sp.]|jgi:DNA-binding response OmpR family regulator|uniref:response regulator transcription factor n=1 Tax=Paenibacillus sp. TaxID=58172 RepID=UPI002822024C|nr:response regulator transcription factor [Paenibacillus sp.]MDR0269792.1 response regulator transcription factor [Paenibacillus sp.]